MRKWLVGTVGGLVLALGGLVGAAPAFAASGCLHDTCNGLDPTQSYNQNTGGQCSAGAYTALSTRAFGGTLELRWGPNCETNWTRFTPADNGQYEIWVTRLSDGVWAGDGLYHAYVFSNGSGVTFYGDQVYSPGPASACVLSFSRNQEVCISQ